MKTAKHTQTQTRAYTKADPDRPLTPAEYQQGLNGLALFYLTCLIPIVLGVALCALFTPTRKR
jgi:hypothetical protein